MASLRMHLTPMLRCEEQVGTDQAQRVGKESSHLAAVLYLTVCSQSLHRGHRSGTQMGLSIIKGVGNGGESPSWRTGRCKTFRVEGTENHGRQWEGRNSRPVGIPIAG